jgi:hypothetical protein
MLILGLGATDEVILSLWRATWRRKPRRRRRQPRRRRLRRSSLRADSFLYLWTRDVAAKSNQLPSATKETTKTQPVPDAGSNAQWSGFLVQAPSAGWLINRARRVGAGANRWLFRLRRKPPTELERINKADDLDRICKLASAASKHLAVLRYRAAARDIGLTLPIWRAE